MLSSPIVEKMLLPLDSSTAGEGKTPSHSISSCATQRLRLVFEFVENRLNNIKF
jgi:hypothetical protein